MYEPAIFLCAIVAGAIAAVSGFGIGSLLTPLFALHAGTKTAVAAVSIPHLVGTAIRFWRLRGSLDRAVLWRFGLTSAAGGLAGALLNAQAPSPALTIVFGSLLVFAGSGAAHRSGAALAISRQRCVDGRRACRDCSAAWSATRAASARRRCSASICRRTVRRHRDRDRAVRRRGAHAGLRCVRRRRWRRSGRWSAGDRRRGRRYARGERLLKRVPERRFKQMVGAIILLLGIVILCGGTADAGRGMMAWLIYAFASAVAAAATAILAKIGVEGVPSTLATAFRTTVVLVIAWTLVLAFGERQALMAMPRRSWIFLSLSGVATGLSWLAYFRALQLGPASSVAPIDKLSLPLTIILAAPVLGESITWKVGVGVAMMTAGALLTIL